MTNSSRIFAFGFVVISLAPSAYAGVIERPAGAIPTYAGQGQRQLISRGPVAKSVVIPLRRKINLAVADGKERKSAEIAVSDDTAGDVDPWDSAVRRFDQQDPSKTVSRGVRVEDIIEPTSDYQYSASRRKNPFVPELVLGRDVKGKELHPNDVEIPIISPLQAYPVKELSVVGVWEGDDHVMKALIETKGNQAIEAKLGDPAGDSGGRIMSITPDAVIVREFFVRPDGTREYSDKPIKMGGDKTTTSSELPGERWILRPGESKPILDKGAPTGSILSTPPVAVPSGVPGSLSTLVPQIPAGLNAPAAANPLIQSPVAPVKVQGGQ